MFGLFRRKEEQEVRNLRELFEKRSEEVENTAWISTAIVGTEGLKIFLKKRNDNYNVERLLPYAQKLFQSALKFHEKSHPGLKIANFEPPRVLIYQMDTREIVFVVKGFSEKLDFFVVYIVDPELSPHFSIDKGLKKLRSWVFKISQDIDKILGRGEH
jgi:hypothetical protein